MDRRPMGGMNMDDVGREAAGIPWRYMDRQPMDDDVERHGDPENTAKATVAIVFCLMLFMGVFVCAPIIAVTVYFCEDARYSVAIDSASALDPRMGVSFNLTLSVKSKSHGAKACIKPGTFVEVSYCGVQLAASNGAETRRTCARPRNVAELHVVARATMTPVGGVLDSLAAEMGRGAALFDVTLLVPQHPRSGKDNLLVSDCERGRVGDAAMACDSDSYKTREYS